MNTASESLFDTPSSMQKVCDRIILAMTDGSASWGYISEDDFVGEPGPMMTTREALLDALGMTLDELFAEANRLRATLNPTELNVSSTGKEAPRSSNCRGRDTEGVTSMCDESIAEKDAEARKIKKQAIALRKSELNVIRAAESIVDADPDKTYPWLHKAVAKLARARAV